MKIVTFCNIDEKLLDSSFTVEGYEETSGEADIAIIDITSIFDFEENKAASCKEKFASIAILDDEDDYDAFKNFGIDAWIKHEDLSKINELIAVLKKRFLS